VLIQKKNADVVNMNNLRTKYNLHSFAWYDNL